MNIFILNAVCGSGSTGRMVAEMAAFLKRHGHRVMAAYGVGEGPEWAVKINSRPGYCLHNGLSRLTDHAGLYSRPQTRYLIQKIREFQPDVVHIHTLHGYYVNYELLCGFLTEAGIPVVMTLHDCWSFTGHCTHFTGIRCDQWKTGCASCPQLRRYPVCYGRGDAARNWQRKRQAFTGLPNLTIVTPSRWLGELAEQSFLGKFPIQVIPNGIDLTVFRPTPGASLPQGKPILLGAAGVWEKSKGLFDFYRLAWLLPEHQIVLAGLSPAQRRALPPEILGLGHISDPRELAALYTAASVFVNPTREDTFPTVNLEAQACGTPVVTYDSCGCPETLLPGGRAVAVGDVEALARTVREGLPAPGDPGPLDRERAMARYLTLYERCLRR